MKRTRKCKCGKEFDIFENDFIKDGKRYVEVDCYKDKLYKKGFDKTEVEDIVDKLVLETRSEKEKLLNKEKDIINKKIESKRREVNRTESLNKLIEYFKYNYDVTVFPKYFYIKLAEINRGTYKGITTGIPYEDLLIMFEKKQKDLNRINMSNYNKGNVINGLNRINYDLAIIISKYDSFLKWKNSKKVFEIENNTDNKECNDIDYSKISNKSNCNNNKCDEVDILGLIDDIY